MDSTTELYHNALSSADLVKSRSIEILAMTEKWLGTLKDADVLSEMAPHQVMMFSMLARPDN